MVRRSSLTFVLQITQVAALVGMNIVVTRATGASGKGIFTLMSLMVTMGTAITALGIGWAAAYFIGRRLFPVGAVAGTLLTSSLVSSAVTLIGLGAGFLLFRDSYFAAVSNAQFVVTLALVPVVQFGTTLTSIILATNRPIHFAAVSLAQWVVTFGLQTILALAGRLDPTLALSAWLAGATLGVIVGFSVASRHVRLRFGLDRNVLRQLLGFGLKGYIANLLMFFNYRLDSLIVNALLGVASVGIYSIAVAMAEVIWNMAGALSTVMFPHVSSLDRKQANRLTPVVSRNVWFLTLVAVVFAAMVGHWVIEHVFGTKMLGAAKPLLLLLPGILTLSGAKVLSSYLSGIGRPIYSTYIASGSVILTVVLDLVFIPRNGIAGAAAVSSVVYTLTAIATVVVFRKESGAGILETIVIQPQDFGYYTRAVKTAVGRIATPSAAKP
ncbi:MAG TPA: oligosaccharide flippase family protein [Candidatus Acidoferrum sp.]|nr:oligosaccharide flippase family protein [Candidatus Acidoferrum sp.]